MAEVAPTTAACPKCGANVRSGSLFCYNCGDRVTAGAAGEESDGKPRLDQNVSIEHTSVPAPGLRSAASLRRKRDAFVRKPKEVVWEPVTEPADKRFVLVAVLLFVFTMVLVALAFYLK
jgi:hypothetical protein